MNDKLDQARADLDNATGLNPENAQAYHARGLIFQRQGNYQAAITDFDNAIRIVILSSARLMRHAAKA